MKIEERELFLVRAELERRRHEAAQERLARAARRAQATQSSGNTAAEQAQQAQAPRPGLFGWLRRQARSRS